MTDITFRKVDKDNYRDVVKLSVHDNQKNFVAPNDRSLLQSAYEAPENSIPYGIYHQDTLVGFLLVTSNDDNPDEYWIWRFMIDATQQGNGYGKAAMQKLIDDLRAEGKYKILKLSYVPDNEQAKQVYARVGFVEEGIKEEWGEMVASCDLTATG